MTTTAGPASGTVIGEHEEDTGADGGSDAEHHELEDAHRARQMLLAMLAAGRGHHVVDVLLPEQGWSNLDPWHCSSTYPSAVVMAVTVAEHCIS